MRTSTLNSEKFRYFMIGGWNTVLGYCVSLMVYYYFFDLIGLIAISIVANIFSITSAFMLYKLFVFRTKGRWIEEYFKAYVTYGMSAAIGIALVWFFVEKLKTPFWLAQLVSLTAVVGFSYVMHKKFTFRERG